MKINVLIFDFVISRYDENETLRLYEAVLNQIYIPLCSGQFSGYLDDEPPPRLSLTSVKTHVAPALDKIISDCKSQKFSEDNGLESTALSLLDKLEAIHGTSFRSQNGMFFSLKKQLHGYFPGGLAHTLFIFREGRIFQYTCH